MDKKSDVIDLLNQNAPEFIRLLGGKVVDLEDNYCQFEFDIGKAYCHSIDIVQGGFITAMLDAAMSHAVFGNDLSVIGVSSLEIKTSYLEPTRAGKLKVEGHILKSTYKTAFMEGKLFNAEGQLCATASTVSKLARAKK